jgi:hypothetical protein
MGGGIMQVIRTDKSNYIVGNPQMTFFKSVYKRHTNFAMETIEVTMNSYPTVNQTTTTAIIPKNAGDLLGSMFYDVLLTGNAQNSAGDGYVAWMPASGYSYIKEVSLLIGNQEIEKHFSEWFDIWNELTDIDLKEHLLVNKHNDPEQYLAEKTLTNGAVQESLQLYIPLKFFFCRNPGLYLPLIALQYDDIEIKTMFRKLDFLINAENTATTASVNPQVKLFANYIYLDEVERRIFTQKPHEYLIDQIQHNGKVTLDVNSNIEGSSITKGNDYFNYTSPFGSTNEEFIGGESSPSPFSTAKIVIDGNDRFSELKASYFRTVQPYYHHSKVPQKQIFSYSFALYPEKHQPSGFCDFTKYKNITLTLNNPISNANLLVFAVGYNVLRVSEGKAALAYLI